MTAEFDEKVHYKVNQKADHKREKLGPKVFGHTVGRRVGGRWWW